MAEDSEGRYKVLATNRKARHLYQIEDTIECGIELRGTEVKSLKIGQFSFSDSYGRIRDGQLYLVGFHITAYTHGNLHNHEPDRERRLLAHKKEILRLRRQIDERGFTLVPLKVYLRKGLVKIELGLGRGKKLFDKRESIKQRDQKRDSDRELRRHI